MHQRYGFLMTDTPAPSGGVCRGNIIRGVRFAKTCFWGTRPGCARYSVDECWDVSVTAILTRGLLSRDKGRMCGGEGGTLLVVYPDVHQRYGFLMTDTPAPPKN